MTDRDRNVTRWRTARQQPHFLDQIINGSGQSILSGQFNTSGRLTQMTNATGNSATLCYNLSNSPTESRQPRATPVPLTTLTTARAWSAKSVDANGNVTNYTYSGQFPDLQDPDRWHKPPDHDLHQQRLRRALDHDGPGGKHNILLHMTSMAIQRAGTDSLGATTYTNYYLDTSRPERS